ncbi:alpha/beta hydrolase [Paenibacillus shirakamiensis]|nr:alpha/beta hydrolase [Paenibacillus shirakamiensis]
MHCETFYWYSKDGTKISACSWTTDKQPVRAVIGIVHGLGEHRGCYEHVAAYFTSYGYAVMAFDQRGHGETEGKKMYTPSYEELLENVDILIKEMDTRYPDAPALLYSHSMGGNITLNYLIRYRPKVIGAIVASPWLKLMWRPPSLAMLWGIAREQLQPNYRYPGMNQRATSDPVMLQRYTQDPLRYGMITPTLFSCVHRAGRIALTQAHKLRTPILLMHGEADLITSAKASAKFADRADARYCTFHSWAGFRHELHTEKGRDQVMARTVAWMEEQLDQSSNQRDKRLEQ